MRFKFFEYRKGLLAICRRSQIMAFEAYDISHQFPGSDVPYSPMPFTFSSARVVVWNCACEEMIDLSVAIAAVSFELSRADSRFGIAIAAMMAMIAITIISSMSVNPRDRTCFSRP